MPSLRTKQQSFTKFQNGYNCIEGNLFCEKEIKMLSSTIYTMLQPVSGADPVFQVKGGALKKMHRAEGGAKIFGVFCVKNHDFMPKNLIFSNFRGGEHQVHPPPLDSDPEFYNYKTSEVYK